MPHPAPTGSRQPLLARHSLSALSPHERHALYCTSGMHSPNDTLRSDTDAFDLRPDVCVEDACFTSLRLLRITVAQLELLGTRPDLTATHREVVHGIAWLARLACGALGLVDTALHDAPPPEPTRHRPSAS